MVYQKKCTKCGIEKELDEFFNRAASKDGKFYECKVCMRARSKVYNDKHREKVNAKQREYQINYRKNNPDKIKEYSDNNKDKAEKDRQLRVEKCNNTIHTMFDSGSHNVTYVIVSDGYYKIGYTTNLQRRIENLKIDIDVHNIFIINKNIERRLLKELNNYRFTHDVEFGGYTECFNFNSDIATFILNREGFKEFD